MKWTRIGPLPYNKQLYDVWTHHSCLTLIKAISLIMQF